MAEDKDWSSLLAAANDDLPSEEGRPLTDGEKLLAIFAHDDSDNTLHVPNISDNHTTALLTSPDGVAYLAEDVSVSADKSVPETESHKVDEEDNGWYSYQPDDFTKGGNPFPTKDIGSQPEFSSWEDEVARFEGKTIDITDPITAAEAEAVHDVSYDEAASLMSGGRGNNDVIIPALPKESPTEMPSPQPEDTGKDKDLAQSIISVAAAAAPTSDDAASSSDIDERSSQTPGGPDSVLRPFSLTGVLPHTTSRATGEASAANDENAASATGDSADEASRTSPDDLPPMADRDEPVAVPPLPEEEAPTDKTPDGEDDDSEDEDPAFHDLSSLARVITVSCLVPVLVAWALLAYSLYIGRENALEHSYSETRAQAEVFREHAERNLGLADEYTAHIKRSYESGDHHFRSSIENDSYRKIFPYKIYITDANDKLVSGRHPGGNEAFARLYADHFIVNKAVNSDNLYISRTLWDEGTKSWSFSASRRLNGSDGSYAGSIIFTINPQQFFDYYQQDYHPENQRIFLLGRDLMIRASRTGSHDFIDSILHNQEVISALKSGTTGSFTASADVDDEPYIYSYAALHNYPLIVVAGRTKATALTEANRRAVNYAILALICMVSGFILWRLLLKLINRQYDTEKDLRRVQAELRQSVERRTAELVQTNATLTETNNSLATLNRDLGDEIDRRRLAEEARRIAGEKLEYIAYHDAVTGLPNQAYLLDWLEKDIANQGTGIIALIFINNLDEINDAFGYETGNELIQTVAKELTKADTGLTDAVVSHLGYGRFCIAAPGYSTAAEAPRMADAISRALSHITEIRSILIHVTATMGFVLYPEHGTNPTELMQNADNAVATARAENQGGWCLYEERMKEVIIDRITLTAQLRQAIANGEFLLVYQPKTSVTTGKVVSFEALIRWHSPVLGMVRPDQFIPLAEQNGLIAPIGEWVMREGCRFAKRLQESGWKDVTVAINVSGEQFAAENFMDVVKDAIASTGIPNDAVEIEITETAVISSLTQAIEKISLLRENGIRIALDDFGVRYSTLSYLLRLPFDILKVDKSFVDNIGVTDHGTDIVRMIIELAHLLGKEVVAEGVESRDQYDILAGLHCDIIQGYYFSKPLNETNAFEYLRREERWSM